MEPVIEIKKLTKNYGEGRGIFDIDLAINKGEMVGFAEQTVAERPRPFAILWGSYSLQAALPC